MSLLLGPAGSGKTIRCLAEIGEALTKSPEGPPLLLVAPKQTTYQLEREILADRDIPGYTRLHILSFERLAYFIFASLRQRAPNMLDEEGRLMVLRALLSRKRDQLKLFRASARLTGFAQHLSLLLKDLQRSQITPSTLSQLAAQMQANRSLAYKLQDLATLLQEYLDWLTSRDLRDADCLLRTAAEALRNAAFHIQGLWVDGFSEWSAQELELLEALAPRCEHTTLTFCLEAVPAGKFSWLSTWSVTERAFEECRKRFEGLPSARLSVEILARAPDKSRFARNPVLTHLETHWAEPKPFAVSGEQAAGAAASNLSPSAPCSPSSGFRDFPLRVAICANPEAEATFAAREILRHVRGGGRFREVMALVRSLEGYHEVLQRVFSRYQIPFFLDRREAVSHHPLTELTRSALRVIALGWQHEDWFAALKTGLAPAADEDIDRLENEALARGWKGAMWQKPIVIANDAQLTEWLAALHRRIAPPFQQLGLELAAKSSRLTGPHLAAALRRFWEALDVQGQLQTWAVAQGEGARAGAPSSIHSTVWEQINNWLANVELAFAAEPLSLRDWLPILEAGLAGLTVGVIPPALDQVLLGAIDRSRNPDVKLALVLGLSEGMFPAPSQANLLLSDSDRAELEKRNVLVGATMRQHLGRERYLAYIACTRARGRLILTSALHDAGGAPLNPSPFLSHLRRLFPSLEFEHAPRTFDWHESEHSVELISPLLKLGRLKTRAATPKSEAAGVAGQAPAPADRALNAARSLDADLSMRFLETLPALGGVLEQLRQFRNPEAEDSLSPDMAGRLYGPVLRTSVSRIEQFAACPFKFFVHSGLRAEERKKFELDRREQGSFQHDALMVFHEELDREGKRWRDITPAQARERMARLARGLVASYREGLMQASEQGRFMARVLSESLQDFVETLVGWMHTQYRFDPAQVELPFGDGDDSVACSIPLGNGHSLQLQGRIDRVDLCQQTEGGEALCVVVDYKSGQKRLDPLLLAQGLQLQLLAYLNVLRRWPNPREVFRASKLVPAGVFYVSLRGKYGREQNRRDALAGTEEARKLAYIHNGRFDLRALRLLDARPDADRGDQFNYRLNQSGDLDKRSREVLTTSDFEALLNSVDDHLKRMGLEIFSGRVKVDPFRRGAATACDHCEYRSICRIDPWTHRYRVLREP